MGEGERRRQLLELGPVGARSSRRAGLRERGRNEPLGPGGGDLLEIGDLARGARSRSRTNGERDLLLL